MEILLWLVPSVLVTVVASAWVAWLGREGRGEVDREEAVARLGSALSKELPRRYVAPPAAHPDRSTGVAVRRPPPKADRAQPPADREQPKADGAPPTRRAS